MSDGDKTIKLGRGDESRPSLDAFRQAWIDSGLHPESEIKTFFADLPADLRSADPKSMAQHAVRTGKLTRYQAQAILTGKIKALVLGSYVILDKLGQGVPGAAIRALSLPLAGGATAFAADVGDLRFGHAGFLIKSRVAI